MDKTIRLTDIPKTLKNRWKLILFMTLIFTTASGIISYYIITPVYQASTQILVNQKNSQNQLDATLLRSNIDLINTYSVIIKSPVILDKVIEELDLPLSVDQLNKKILVSSQENSQVFSLTVENPDSTRAVEIVNTISETFQQEIQNIMNVDNVSILAKAELSRNNVPVKPNPVLNITIAFLIGLMTGIGLAILRDFIDSTLKNDQDIIDYLQMPVLGSIPKISKSESVEFKKQIAKHNVGSESVVS